MILLATASAPTLLHYTECLRSFGTVLPLPHFQLLFLSLEKLKPSILFLDFSLPDLGGVTAIHRIREAHPAIKIVILGHRISEDIKLDLFVAGVHGYCSIQSAPLQIERVITAIRQGEICMPRALILPLLERLQNLTCRPSSENAHEEAALLSLTRREKEISLLVGHGHCNKEIARKLGIAERTVKAHLTEIFRKLRVNDRLSLALRISTTPPTLPALPQIKRVDTHFPPALLRA